MPESAPRGARGRYAKIRAMPHLHSVCPLDCPDRCTLDVTVENGRVTRISGTNENPITAGFLCTKVSRGFAERMYGP